MILSSSKTHAARSIRLTSLAAACLVIAGPGCAAGKGNPAPAGPAAATKDGQRPVTDFALVSADPGSAVVPEVPEDRTEALSLRAELRAFPGAPPTIPHEIEQRSSVDCLRCHGDSPQADEKGAPKVPHAFLTSCTQCHVEQESEALFGDPLAPNGFAGMAAPPGGARAYVGAPPLVPHATLMRSNCLACHGPFGLAPLRTSHPQRQNCLQCHAVSARLNQRAAR
jgi:cytochrome c-type protein NapB